MTAEKGRIVVVGSRERSPQNGEILRVVVCNHKVETLSLAEIDYRVQARWWQKGPTPPFD